MVKKIGTKEICYVERLEIEKLVSEGCTGAQIARAIGRSNYAVFVELKRSPHPYKAKIANDSLLSRRKNNLTTDKVFEMIKFKNESGASFKEVSVRFGVSMDQSIKILRSERQYIKDEYTSHQMDFLEQPQRSPDELSDRVSNLEEKMECLEMQLDLILSNLEALSSKIKQGASE